MSVDLISYTQEELDYQSKTPLATQLSSSQDQEKAELLMEQVDPSILRELSTKDSDNFNSLVLCITKEMKALEAEAHVLWNVVLNDLEDVYSGPHYEMCLAIQAENKRKGINPYIDTGHVLVKPVEDKRAKSRPSILRQSIEVRDYARLKNGNPKNMAMASKKNYEAVKKGYYKLNKYLAKDTSNNPSIRVACHPFDWTEIKRCSRPWELELMQNLAATLHPTLRRYCYLVDTYKQLLSESESLYRDLAVNLKLMPRIGNGKQTFKNLTPLFEKYYPSIDIMDRTIKDNIAIGDNESHDG